MIDVLRAAWPRYVAGSLLGLLVPPLLLLRNEHFGISVNLRHGCAACFPAEIPFFQYKWRKERWNMLFVAGIVIGAALEGGCREGWLF